LLKITNITLGNFSLLVWIFPATGFPFCQLKVQALPPQQAEACKAYLDSSVQEAAQEGTTF
jgi:hypothetical protein